MLLHGDCLRELQKIDTSSVNLIYLDPPFFTQKKHTLKTKDNFKEYSFLDRWKDIVSYKEYIRDRLVYCHNVLKDTGSIFLHCDRTASHYLRIALDDVFGFNNFRSEIVWSYRRWSNSKKGLLNCHQLIYFYSKTNFFKFHTIYGDYSPTTNIDQIFQERIRNKNGKTTYKSDENGNYVLMKEKKGVPLSDVWEIPYLNPKAKERVGYPTQKPVLLLERIIKLVTDNGDIVLDPFCGSGTTLVAAKLLNRKSIGIDISKDAIELTTKRLVNPEKSESNLLKKGKQAYINQDKEILYILNKLEALPVQRNKGIDGFLRLKGSVKAIPVRIQKKNETLQKAKELLLKSCKKNGYTIKVVIETNEAKCEQLCLFDKHVEDSNLIIENIENITNNGIVKGLHQEIFKRL